MAVESQDVNDKYALYHGDCIEVMKTLPPESIHLSVFSLPFAGLYVYSSDERDLSNCLNYNEFFEHYAYVVQELHRVTLPGRMTAVHCMDIPTGNTGHDHLQDFPGDIIRLHAKHGWDYVARYHVWKEPLTVRNRTMTKSLSHQSVTLDSTKCSIASADYLLIFRRSGVNIIPVDHPHGLTEYCGERPVPSELLKYRNWQGNQIENRYSQWVWRQYASAFWDDVRIDRVLPYKAARDADDERHVHALQLDVIDRVIIMWSNPGENIFSPFMGIGSEVYCAVRQGRKGIGVDLKASYYHQAVANMKEALIERPRDEETLFDDVTAEQNDEALDLITDTEEM